MYIVKYTSGEWDDYREVDIFVTDSKELAEAYVEKFNKILNQWKTFLNELNDKNQKNDFMYTKNPILNRYFDIIDINLAKFEEIERRF